MKLNPEFQRQLYLECSQARLIGIPSVLGVIFTFTYFIDGHQLASFTANTALTLFMLITLLWGARQTVDSIIEEHRERTWDIQRLSALGPWEMTWGKLLGSTIMVWYSAIICLMVYSLAGDHAALDLLFFYCVSSALFVQSASFLLGLLAVQRGQTKTGSIFMLAVVGFLLVAPWLTEVSRVTYSVSPIPTIYWYSAPVDSNNFYRISLLLALFWCNVGNYRLMTNELGMRTQPWVWLGFLLFLIIYLGGFIPNASYPFSLAAFAVCGAMTYVGILVEQNDAMRIKRLSTYFSSRNWRRVSEEIPIWWLSFFLMLPFALWLNLADHPLQRLSSTFHFYPLAIVLILLRDCAIYLYFIYGKNPQRAFSLTLLSGALLYAILPGIFSAIGQASLAALFFPLWAESASGALICAALQTGLILNLLYHRWKLSI